MFKHGIFYCPKSYEDIKFYGNFYAESYSMLQIQVTKKNVPGADKYFQTMNLVLLVNDKIIVYDETTPSPELKSYSDFMTFPIT